MKGASVRLACLFTPGITGRTEQSRSHAVETFCNAYAQAHASLDAPRGFRHTSRWVHENYGNGGISATQAKTTPLSAVESSAISGPTVKGAHLMIPSDGLPCVCAMRCASCSPDSGNGYVNVRRTDRQSTSTDVASCRAPHGEDRTLSYHRTVAIATPHVLLASI
eukprot:7235216-Pyramimonas_sp.AAC.1